MRDRFNNKVKDSIENHYFNIKKSNECLVFQLKNAFLPLSKKFLIIKHRKTGKRISKQLANSKATLTFDDINMIGEEGFFDVYLHVNVFGRFYRKRSSFNFENNIDQFIFDKENKFLFSSYPTQNSNLSFRYNRSSFQANLEDIKAGDGGMLVRGNIELFDDIELNCVELLAKSNKVGRKSAECVYSQDGSNITFEGCLDEDIAEEDIASKWEMEIRLINDDFLISHEKLSCDKLINYDFREGMTFEKDEITIDGQKAVIIFYPTKNLDVQFKVMTPEKYLKSQQRLKDKKTYNKFRKLGLKSNYVFFESFHGRYNNNPKYLYEKMLELGLDKRYQFIWAYDGEDELPGNPIVVKSNSDDYFKYLAQSKYRVNNTTFPILDKRNKIVYIQTWHGTPLKRLAHDIRVKGGVSWNHFNREVKTWNYLISANSYSTNIFKRAFKYKKEVLEVGYPANDVFYFDDDKKDQILNKFDLPEGKKVILYAPTFRDDKKDDEGNRIFDLKLDLEKLSEKLSDDYILIIKTHYVISKNLEIDDKLEDFVIDLSSHDDIHELFLLADILITDYSSSFFDFAHSKKPILFFMPDLKSYENARGLYPEVLMDLPGPIVVNNDEIIERLNDFDNIADEEKYSRFYDKYCLEGNGQSSYEIIKHVWGD